MREYGFELALCAHLEDTTDGIVARQLGGGVHDPGGRILDIVVINPGPQFDERRAITPHTIPPLAIESAAGPGRFRRWPVAGELHPSTAEAVLAEATEVGFFEHERNRGMDMVRQAVRYPDWIGSITAIENKPDLGAPGDLREQLRWDISLGLVDQVVLATASHVTGAHLHRIPDAVGVWRVLPDGDQLDVIVIREPTPLPSDTWGIEIGASGPLETTITPVSSDEIDRTRIRLGERAYGKGWRPEFPACAQASPKTVHGSEALPHCAWKDHVIDPATCGPGCPGHQPGEPLRIDRVAERAERTGWNPDPTGVTRKQSGLDEFGA